MMPMIKTKITSPLFYLIICLCFTPILTAPVALATGIAFTLTGFSLPAIETNRLSRLLLQVSVVLLGFSMNLTKVIETSVHGFFLTVVSVSFTILSGLGLAWFLKTDRKTSLLIACGTAICGGSAIAAVSPLIQARKEQISFALIVVFVLNSIALLIFPVIGNFFHLSQETFGYWSAIAIHDTSSVVGAGSAYGAKALEIATTVKLTRVLWIIPLSLLLFLVTKPEPGTRIQTPWFILLFIGALLLGHLLPDWSDTFNHLGWLGHRFMTVTLFLIGSSLSLSEIKTAGVRPFIFGVTLWLIVAVSSFIILKP